MLRNMAVSLLQHERIKTTLPKAKELRRVVEPLITLAKSPGLANRRLAFDRLRNRAMVVKLFDELGPRYAYRPGGYLRILKMGFRQGDNAPMAYVEMMNRPEEVSDPATPSKHSEATTQEVLPASAQQATPASSPTTPGPEVQPTTSTSAKE